MIFEFLVVCIGVLGLMVGLKKRFKYGSKNVKMKNLRLEAAVWFNLHQGRCKLPFAG